MSAPSSELTVANMALDILNQDAIAQFTAPVTKTEKFIARWFDQTRRATLRKHTWNFAIKRMQLAAMTDTPAFDYSAQFQLPSDFLRIVEIGGINANLVEYEIEDGKLLINETGPLSFRYIYDHTTVATWDPLFLELFAAELALKGAGKFGKSANDKAELKSYIDDLKSEAHAIDGQERPPAVVQRSRLISARRGFMSRRNDIVE